MISAANKKHLLEFAANGYEFFPLIKPSDGRKLGTPRGWPQLGTDDLATINSWLQTSKFGFGMTFGSKRCFAIDLDGEDGVKYFKDVVKELNIPVPTIIFKTPSGGRHVLYEYPQDIDIKNVSGFDFRTGQVNAGTKCDIRAAGGFIGSFGARENGYILTQGSADTPLPKLPAHIVDILPKKTDTPSLAASAMTMTKELAGLQVDKSQPLFGEIPDTIYDGERDNTLFNLIASWVRCGLSRKNVLLLVNAALKRCEGPTDDIDVISMVDRTLSSPDFVFAKRSMALQTMLDNLVFITDMNRYMLLSDKSIMTKQSVETRFANVNQDVELKNGKTKQMPVFNLWLRDHSRKTYRNIGYKPGGGDVYYDSLVGAQVANMYRDPKIKPVANMELFNKFQEFASVIAGGEDKGRFLVEFVAYLVQKPGKKIGVAPVIISTKQGIGKNFFFKIVDKLIGESNSIVLHSDNITNNFNSATSDRQLIIINESVGDNSMSKMAKTRNDQAMSRIKNMITETNQSIERKGVDIVNMKTYANFIFLSNNLTAIQMTELDRRFRCFINENLPKSKEFFDSMDILKTEKGLGAIKHGLLNIELSMINDYMTSYEKTTDDLRVVNSGLTELEQSIKADIDAGVSIFKSQFMSKEIFMMYMAKEYGDEATIQRCGNVMRVFYEKFRPNKVSKDCKVIKLDMPVFFMNEAKRGGKGRNHFIYQLIDHQKVPLTGDDIDIEFVRRGLELCLKGFNEEDDLEKPHVVKENLFKIDPELIR